MDSAVSSVEGHAGHRQMVAFLSQLSAPLRRLPTGAY
jgi:hypothetical protein